MSFARLPAEILVLIAGYLGPGFFHENVGRLRLCKRWFNAAYPVFWEEAEICQHRLHRLWSSPARETCIELLRQNARSIKVIICVRKVGDGEPDCTGEPEDAGETRVRSVRRRLGNRFKAFLGRGKGDGALNEGVDFNARMFRYFKKREQIKNAQWKNRLELNDELSGLGHALRTSSRLIAIGFDNTRSTPSYPYLVSDLNRSTISSWIEIGAALTSLNIASYFMAHLLSEDDEEPLHLCPSILARLRTLQSLKLRLALICPAVINLSRLGLEVLPLRRVVIRLEISVIEMTQWPVHHECDEVASCSLAMTYQELVADMKARLKSLVPAMKAEVACLTFIEPVGDHRPQLLLYDALDDSTTEVLSPWVHGVTIQGWPALKKNGLCNASDGFVEPQSP